MKLEIGNIVGIDGNFMEVQAICNDFLTLGRIGSTKPEKWNIPAASVTFENFNREEYWESIKKIVYYRDRRSNNRLTI